MKTHRFRYEGATAKLQMLDDDKYVLSSLYSRTAQRGHARGLLETITRYADSRGWTLILSVSRYRQHEGKELNNIQLEAFYGRFGFKRNEGSLPPHTMTRHPKRKDPSCPDQ